MVGYFVFALVAVGLLWTCNRARTAAGVPLLRATVGTVDGGEYTVLIEKLRPDVEPVEYIWMILFFATKMMYNLWPTDAGQVGLFQDCIKALGNTQIGKDTNVFEVCRMPKVEVSEATAQPAGKRVVATLYYPSITNRVIRTSIPLSPVQLQYLYSWLSLVQTALPRLNSLLLDRLQGALKVMGHLYEECGVDAGSLVACADVPSKAFFGAEPVVERQC